MSVLKSLTLTAAPKPTNDPVEKRRRKLILQLEQQRSLVENPHFQKVKQRWEMDDEGGKHLVDVAQSVKRWWYVDAKGSYILTARYGTRLLEFERGKTAIVVGSKDNLIPTITKIIEAVEVGELDDAIAATQKFGQRPKMKAA